MKPAVHRKTPLERVPVRSSLRPRWRRFAWDRAGAGRMSEALALQRALVAAAPHGRSRRDLGDRLRLLRWEIASGKWPEALSAANLSLACLARRRMLDRRAAAWVRLARAVALFQLGDGARFRKEMAAVLRLSRRRRHDSLARAALRVAAVWERLALEPGAPRGLLARLEERTRCRRPPLESDGSQGDEAALIALLDALDALRPSALGRPFSWDRLPDLIEGSPPARRFSTRLERLGSMLGSMLGAAPAVADADAGAPGSQIPGARLLLAWMKRAEDAPGRATPVWLVPILARVAEEWSPEAGREMRLRVHRRLSGLAAQVSEPWARAALLESLAEITLWLAANEPLAPGEQREVEAALSQARADLGLAAGLLRRLGWKERAGRCEERWARLALPSFGSRVAEPEARAVHAVSASRRSLGSVRQSLAEVGFLTADARVLRELSPLLLLATTSLPVLILGESGTGKEVVARALHRWSQLRGEFVPIHCGAIPRDLLESELFGHTRGAFTGANQDKAGLVEAADGGTLFLDEIGEMGMEAQMKMLRVLESGEVRRLGDLRARRASIRLVAATHRNLEESVKSGAFRLDLYHRVRGVAVRLRPLRERRGDIPLLAARYLGEWGQGGSPLQLADASLASLLAHDWPGNVRELRGVILRSAHLARALELGQVPPELLGLPCASSLPPGEELAAHLVAESALPEIPAEESVAANGLESVLEQIERRLITKALEQCAWNRTRAARVLGNLSRTTLISKMKRLGIERNAADGGAPGEDA